MKVKSSKELKPNFKHWNQLGNTFGITTSVCKYPKNLLYLAEQEFKSFCEELHIDMSFYKYVEITMKYDVWQIDYYDNEECKGACISIYNIYLDSNNKKILQCGRSAQ